MTVKPKKNPKLRAGQGKFRLSKPDKAHLWVLAKAVPRPRPLTSNNTIVLTRYSTLCGKIPRESTNFLKTWQDLSKCVESDLQWWTELKHLIWLPIVAWWGWMREGRPVSGVQYPPLTWVPLFVPGTLPPAVWLARANFKTNAWMEHASKPLSPVFLICPTWKLINNSIFFF